MAWPDAGSSADGRADFGDIRRLIRAGRSAEALQLAESIGAESTDPYTIVRALLMRLGCTINLGRMGECPALVDQAFDALRSFPEPSLFGELHALAAWVAYLDGSLDRCVSHLVRSSRALGTVERPDIVAADSWVDLAIAYSYIGFHGHALGALDKCREVAASAGLPASEYVIPEIRVRLAVSLDHRGDSDGCVRVLRDVLTPLAGRPTDASAEALPAIDLPYLGYAIVRLAALGVPTELDPRPLFTTRGESHPEIIDLLLLSEACTSINEGRPAEALSRLGHAAVDPRTLGAAEVPRLRAIAHAAAGDGAAAHAADREAFRIVAQSADRLRDLFIDGVAARIDHEDLRRTVARYADEALTDPLTGLPNRRHLEHHVDTMARRGEQAVLGVLDLDAFKSVNTAHGHLSGDLVLQRVAAILARVMRRGDFVARFGGDEFVVVLPATTLPEAYEIGRRVSSAITSEDWDALVPGTALSATIGWAELDVRTGINTAFEAADRAMLQAKHAARAS